MSDYYTGIKITEEYLNFRVGNSDLTEQHSLRINLPKDINTNKLINLLGEGFYALLKKNSINNDNINAVALSVPATINYKKGYINCSSVIPLLNGIEKKLYK